MRRTGFRATVPACPAGRRDARTTASESHTENALRTCTRWRDKPSSTARRLPRDYVLLLRSSADATRALEIGTPANPRRSTVFARWYAWRTPPIAQTLRRGPLASAGWRVLSREARAHIARAPYFGSRQAPTQADRHVRPPRLTLTSGSVRTQSARGSATCASNA